MNALPYFLHFQYFSSTYEGELSNEIGKKFNGLEMKGEKKFAILPLTCGMPMLSQRVRTWHAKAPKLAASAYMEPESLNGHYL
jgi:hypothetical protein